MGARVAKHLFLSWAHADQRAKDALIGLLATNLRILSGMDLRWWEDSDILVGEDWRRRILARLDECDYGVLLLSPAFYASGFITGQELPRFIGDLATKGALPVALKRVPLDGSRDLHGVDRHQVFTMNGRAFDELRGNGRERFALDLATAIRARVLADS
jgi:hypothetical protein